MLQRFHKFAIPQLHWILHTFAISPLIKVSFGAERQQLQHECEDQDSSFLLQVPEELLLGGQFLFDEGGIVLISILESIDVLGAVEEDLELR